MRWNRSHREFRDHDRGRCAAALARGAVLLTALAAGSASAQSPAGPLASAPQLAAIRCVLAADTELEVLQETELSARGAADAQVPRQGSTQEEYTRYLAQLSAFAQVRGAVTDDISLRMDGISLAAAPAVFAYAYGNYAGARQRFAESWNAFGLAAGAVYAQRSAPSSTPKTLSALSRFAQQARGLVSALEAVDRARAQVFNRAQTAGIDLAALGGDRAAQTALGPCPPL